VHNFIKVAFLGPNCPPLSPRPGLARPSLGLAWPAQAEAGRGAGRGEGRGEGGGGRGAPWFPPPRPGTGQGAKGSGEGGEHVTFSFTPIPAGGLLVYIYIYYLFLIESVMFGEGASSLDLRIERQTSDLGPERGAGKGGSPH